MTDMTKEEALQIEEERSKSYEQRLKELGVLYQARKALVWPDRTFDGEVLEVRARWQKLRERLCEARNA